MKRRANRAFCVTLQLHSFLKISWQKTLIISLIISHHHSQETLAKQKRRTNETDAETRNSLLDSHCARIVFLSIGVYTNWKNIMTLNSILKKRDNKNGKCSLHCSDKSGENRNGAALCKQLSLPHLSYYSHVFTIRFPLPHTDTLPPSPWQKFLWTFVRTRINSQSVTIDRPSIDFVAHFPPAAHSLCTHQLDWQDVCFTLNQSASVPEQTFGLIRQHLGVIWCQRRAGTKKQLGTCWSNAKYCMLYHLVHIQYWISLFSNHF